jgi:1-acyl-sn-glycerol-3-phosphate acyltransferase
MTTTLNAAVNETSPHILTAAASPRWLQRWSIRALALLGWTVAFKPLPGPRGVIIVYPHTSNWDFLYGLLAKWAIGLPFRFLGKAGLFRYGFGTFLRAVGGEPIERASAQGAIARIIERMLESDFYWLALAPEGTRKYMPTWRSGFYHIALGAKVPLGIVRLDYRAKQVCFIDVLNLTGDLALDTAMIEEKFSGCEAYHPAQVAPILFGEEATKEKS